MAERTAFNIGFTIGLAFMLVGIWFVGYTCSLDYWELQKQAVEHHAAEWVVDTDGSVTFTWIENADRSTNAGRFRMGDSRAADKR